MIYRIIHFSVYNKLIISLFMLALVIWGLYSISHLSIDAVPDITDNQVQIITSSPDLTAQEVERFITFYLEKEMGNIPKVEQIRSISRFGLSVITIVFEENANVYWARNQINEKIQIAKQNIPESFGNPFMGPISTGLGEIYQYVIYPAEGYQDQYDPTTLRSIQDWIIKRQLVGIPGVVEINSSGGFLKQYEISVKQSQMLAYNLGIDEIFEAVAKNNQNAGGSYIEHEAYTYFIRGEGLVSSVQDLENVVIKTYNGVPVLVKHVAEVKIGHAPRYGAVTMNNMGEVVSGQVMMLKGANSMEVTKRVKERIEEIKTTLPEGVMLEPYLDRSKLVRNTTKTVITNLVEGASIVIFILVFMLGNLRAGLIVASVIPLSMLFAVSMMRIFGVSANLMSLGALDFGLIVDGAVIVVEATLHHLGIRSKTAALDKKELNHEVVFAASRIRRSAAFGEIIILIVYLPIMFLSGIEGKMFIPMAQTVSFAIAGALILSTTYVPMMSSLLLKKSVLKSSKLSININRFFLKLYQPTLEMALKYRTAVLVGIILIALISFYRFSRMGGEFIPTLEEGDLALHQILPPGSSLQKGVEVSGKLQKILTDQFPEVEKVVTKIGTAEIPTDIMPLEAGDIYVIMKPKEEWVTAKTREEMFEKMEVALEEFPGIIYEFTQPIQMRFNELMTGVRQDIAIKIIGEDLGILSQLAKQAEGILMQIDGVGDVRVEQISGHQQLVIQYDRTKVAAYGVSIEDLNGALKTAFAGKVAGRFFEGEANYDIVIRMDELERQDVEHLDQLKFKTPSGTFIPFSELASVGFQEGPAQISRENTRRRTSIGVNARNRDIASLIAEIEARFTEDLMLPPGYSISYGGQFENLQRARARLLITVPMALLLILILLFFTFNSFGQAILVFSAIPLASVGGIWALSLRGMPFSISAGVGFIALFGVAVLNGIVLVSVFNQLKKEGMQEIDQIIKKGTQLRLRPVLITTFVASMGFLPMAISNTAGAEVQRPLATVVIGGLISATFLTLVVLPILYKLFFSKGLKANLATMSVMVFLLNVVPTTKNAAQETISVDDFIEEALKFNPLLQSGQFQLEANRISQDQPIAKKPLTLSIGTEEYDPSVTSGVHSLRLQKNLANPKLKSSYLNLLQQQHALIENQNEINEIQVVSILLKTYSEAAYYFSLDSILNEELDYYDRYLEIIRRKVEVQETAAFELRRVNLQYESIANQRIGNQLLLEQLLDLFNQYLDSGAVNIPMDFRNIDQVAVPDTLENPFISQFERQKAFLASQYEVNAKQNGISYQLAAGLQSVVGGFPFYTLQLGVNIPLTGKYLQRQRESMLLQQRSIDSKKEWQQTLYDRRKANMENQLEIMNLQSDRYSAELIPNAGIVLNEMQTAFRMGEIDYTDLYNNAQQYFTLKKEYLTVLQNAFILKESLKYHIYN